MLLILILLLSAKDYLLLAVKVEFAKPIALVFCIRDSKFPDLLRIVGGITNSWVVLNAIFDFVCPRLSSSILLIARYLRVLEFLPKSELY